MTQMLKVKNFPADIYDRIFAEATRSKITFEQQIIALIEKALPKNSANTERRIAVLNRIKARHIPQNKGE